MENQEQTPSPGGKKKIGKLFLAFAGLCVLALPLIVHQAFSTTESPMTSVISDAPGGNFDEKGAAIFRRYDRITADYLQGTSTSRTLEEYYSRRQYAGSPPFIPHKVEPNDETNRTCLTCHASGGPPSGHSCSRPVSADLPSRFGPRHWGQMAFPANVVTGRARATRRARRKTFRVFGFGLVTIGSPVSGLRSPRLGGSDPSWLRGKTVTQGGFSCRSGRLST